MPSYYDGRSDLLAERRRLAAQLDYAQAQFHAARAFGQRKLSAPWATYIKNLNHSIAALDARAAGASYNFPGYMAASPPVLPPQYPYASYPAAGYPSAGGMMSSLLGPMFGSGQIP